MSDVLVIGCGLIGTSVGMALRAAGWDVQLDDISPAGGGRGVRRGAGRPWEHQEKADIVLIAVPPHLTAAALLAHQRLDIGATYTHVSSVQSHVQQEVESWSSDPSVVVGGHPLAGRELSGPGAATSDLFAGRPWALCPGVGTRPDAVQAVSRLAAACGADVLQLSASAHDAAVALLSHLPQVTSSALAACLVEGEPAEDREQLRLAGPGIVDTTRLAASDPDLWVQILELNAAQVAPVVPRLAQQLTATAEALRVLAAGAAPAAAEAAVASVRELLRHGNAGRDLVPVKRGALSAAFAPLRVTVRDEPGRLAALLGDAGAAGVNVEDVHVDHVPGRATGVIELLVARADVHVLADTLRARGWTVNDPD